MRTLTTLTLAMLVLLVACKRAENKAAQEEQTQTPTETMKQEEPSNKLEKFPADYPIGGDSVAVIEVEQESAGALGTMVIEFYTDKAPNHVRNFKWLADHGFYNGVKFHRIIKGFMAQGGDPEGTGRGGPGWTVNAEFNDVKHEKGILSMARTPDPNSAGSQFFLCDSMRPEQQQALDGQYTVFGKLVKGTDVLDKIMNVPVGGPQNSTPLQPLIMKSVTIVSRADGMNK